MNLRWPATPNNDYRPWYDILWRAPWLVLFYLVLSAGWWCVLMMDGIAEATDWWNSAK